MKLHQRSLPGGEKTIENNFLILLLLDVKQKNFDYIIFILHVFTYSES